MRHVIVHATPGRFAAWPANNGVWSWDGQEILVGFTEGEWEEKPGHNINEPYRSMLAKSADQGDSWSVYEPTPFVSTDATARPLKDELDLTDPGLALRVIGDTYHGSNRPEGAFLLSTDRGARWQGPFALTGLADCPELAGKAITARTDYVVMGPRACLFSMSARVGDMLTDRPFCARTDDGGRTFRFLSWIVPPSDPYRGLMPAMIRTASNKLVAAVRRRDADNTCWIDAFASADDGQSWALASRVGATGPGNGNPPAMIQLGDGRLCCVRGDRANCRMIAVYSADQGQTWGQELTLRDDFQPDSYGDPDLGYPRLVQRADGQLIAIYYWATAERPHNHIAATIWDPVPA